MRLGSPILDGDEPLSDSRARLLAVNEAIREPLSAYLDEQQRHRRLVVGAGICCLLLAGGAFVALNGLLVPAVLGVLGVAIAGGGYAYVDRQEPDVTVTGVRKGYWTGYCVPDESGVVVYDADQRVDTTSFDLEQLSDRSAITEARQHLESVREFPVVMPHERNVETEVVDALDDVGAALDGAERRTVEIPVLDPETDRGRAVQFLADRADAEETVATDTDTTLAEAREDVSALADLERLADADDDQGELERVSEASREVVSELSGTQERAIELLNDHVDAAADAFGLVSYRFYCPECLADDIESELSFADPQAETWRCETCRSEVETSETVPRHRIRDEVVNPVWDQLWIEKDDQRREVYENIEDQKRDLQEREFEQSREEIRSTTDRMRDLRSRLRDLKTEAKAAEGKVEEIGDLMVEYERLHEQRKQEFQQNVQAAFSEIDEETERILEETRNLEDERIEEAQEAAKEKARLMREDERKREREKLAAQAQMMEAQTQAITNQQAAVAQAEMNQEENIARAEMNQEQKHHDEQYLAETGSSVTASSRANRFKSKAKKLASTVKRPLK